MTKIELANLYAERYDCTKKDALDTIGNVFDTIMDVVSSGEKIHIVGFGSMEVKERGQRKGINPRTKEEITIEASKYPHFKAGKAFKEKCNG